MNPQRSFVRKIVYLVAMAGLLLVLVWLGQPSTTGKGEGEKGSPGGVLAQLRRENQLSEADLGDVDPTSETIKLVTLGLRGVALNVLWEKSNTCKMKKDWTNLSASLQQIALLAPHFVKVWTFQGWNLSYNVSAEFDDYRERYRWVIKGIEYLQKGIHYNKREPSLVRDVGWFISQKIGRADESKQFRRMFKQDDDFHQDRPPERRDNWLVGKEWFVRAEQIVDDDPPSLKKISPVVFFSNGPMCLMNYSEYLEKDGVFGEVAQAAWIRASTGWTSEEVDPKTLLPALGARSLPGGEGAPAVRLNDREKHEAEAAAKIAQLEAMQPGLREKIRQERLAKLPAAERKAYETPPEKRESARDWELSMKAEDKVKVSHDDVARRIRGEDFVKAIKLAREIGDLEKKAYEITTLRMIVNFDFWRRRAKIEQTREALDAREFVYLGDEAFTRAELGQAKEMFEKGLAQWRLVLDKKEWPDLKKDAAYGNELIEMIQRYRELLEKRDEPFPKDFVLQDIVRLHEKEPPKP